MKMALDERQKKLVREFGPKFMNCSKEAFDSLLTSASYAVSLLTDEELGPWSASVCEMFFQLDKAWDIVKKRMKEADLDEKVHI